MSDGSGLPLPLWILFNVRGGASVRLRSRAVWNFSNERERVSWTKSQKMRVHPPKRSPARKMMLNITWGSWVTEETKTGWLMWQIKLPYIIGTVVFNYENQPIWLDFHGFSTFLAQITDRIVAFWFSIEGWFFSAIQHVPPSKKVDKKRKSIRLAVAPLVDRVETRRLHNFNKLLWYFNIWLKKGRHNRISWTQYFQTAR